MAVLTSFSTVFTFKKLVDCNTTSHSLQQQQHNNIIMSSSADVARLTLALDKERKGRLLAEEKLREAGKESSKQQKQNNGRNYLLKKKKHLARNPRERHRPQSWTRLWMQPKCPIRNRYRQMVLRD